MPPKREHSYNNRSNQLAARAKHRVHVLWESHRDWVDWVLILERRQARAQSLFAGVASSLQVSFGDPLRSWGTQ